MDLPSKHSSCQDVLKTSFVFVFRRRLDQDEYVRLSLTSSEDVFKTSWSRPIYLSWPYVFKTSSRRLVKTSSRHFQDVVKTFWRSLQDVLQKRLQDVFKRSSRHLRDIFKTSCNVIFKTFSRRIIKLNCSC